MWSQISKLKGDLNNVRINLLMLFKKKLGNGRNTSFLHDSWLGRGSGNKKDKMTASDSLNVKANSTVTGDGNVVTSVGSVEIMDSSLDGSKEKGKSLTSIPNSSNGMADEGEQPVPNVNVNNSQRSFAGLVTNKVDTKVNFRSLDTDKPMNANAEVKIPKASILEVHSRFGFSLYGYFMVNRLAFPVVEYYVKNDCQKYGVVRVMMNAKGFFFFKFAPIKGMNREDLNLVPIWVKLHDIPIVSFTTDGLSGMATKLGNSIMLNSYTSSMCLRSWVRMDYACALIDIRVTRELKGEMTIAIPNVEDDEEVIHTHKKQVYQTVSKKNDASSSGTKKNFEVPRHETNSSNLFDALNMIENDDELGLNEGSSNSGKKIIHDVVGLAYGCPSTTSLVARINELESQMLDGKLVLVGDDGKPLRT
ncbi:hypothetical protein Tco_0593988 [Tanacetum coccineum]